MTHRLDRDSDAPSPGRGSSKSRPRTHLRRFQALTVLVAWCASGEARAGVASDLEAAQQVLATANVALRGPPSCPANDDAGVLAKTRADLDDMDSLIATWVGHKKATSERWGGPISQTHAELVQTRRAVQDAFAACDLLKTVETIAGADEGPEAALQRIAEALPSSTLPTYTADEVRKTCQIVASAWAEKGHWLERPAKDVSGFRGSLDEVLSCAGHPDWQGPSSLARALDVVGADAELALIASGPSNLYSRRLTSAVEAYGDLTQTRASLIQAAHAVFAARIRKTVLENPASALKKRKDIETWRSVAADIKSVEAATTVATPVAADLARAIDEREAALDRVNAAYWSRLGTPRGVDRKGVALSSEWSESLTSLSRRMGLRNLSVRVSDVPGRVGNLTGVSRRVELDAELLECKSRDVADMFKDNGPMQPMEDLHVEWIAWMVGPFMVQTGQPGFADTPEYMEINLRNAAGAKMHFVLYDASLTTVRFEWGDEWEEADTSDWAGGLSIGFQASWEAFFSKRGACN